MEVLQNQRDMFSSPAECQAWHTHSNRHGRAKHARLWVKLLGIQPQCPRAYHRDGHRADFTESLGGLGDRHVGNELP